MAKPRRVDRRIMVGLDNATLAPLQELADMQGIPLATFVSNLLQEVGPHLIKTIRMVRKAQEGLKAEALTEGLDTLSDLQQTVGSMSKAMISDLKGVAQ